MSFTRILHSEFPLHITGRCNNRELFPVEPSRAWEIFSDNLHILSGMFGIQIHAFVMMLNHFHLICRDPGLQISKGMQFFMRETSLDFGRESGRINRIWGAPFYSTVIGDPLYYLHAYKYLYRNPVAAGACSTVESYPWSTLQILLGRQQGWIPMVCDDTLFSDVEGTLRWLNTGYGEEEAEALKMGLTKRQFKLPKVPSGGRCRQPHPLTSWASVPFTKSEEVT